MMKIFISHKKEDKLTALKVLNTLTSAGVDAYLDLLDNITADDGEKLTKHIRGKLRECTDVIVILSSNTKKSWWVPFEIGMATEKDMPIANYLISQESLPDYLTYWPRLKSQGDVLKYVEIRNKISKQIILEKALNHGYYQRADGGISETQKFYQELKKHL